jgi:hypothetical protein
MTRKAAARSQHEPGAARKETEQGTGRKARPAKRARGTEEPARRPQKRIRREGQADQPGAQADAVAEISTARAAWLEMIRALARAAAQADHDAATRTTGRPVSRND